MCFCVVFLNFGWLLGMLVGFSDPKKNNEFQFPELSWIFYGKVSIFWFKSLRIWVFLSHLTVLSNRDSGVHFVFDFSFLKKSKNIVSVLVCANSSLIADSIKCFSCIKCMQFTILQRLLYTVTSTLQKNNKVFAKVYCYYLVLIL